MQQSGLNHIFRVCSAVLGVNVKGHIVKQLHGGCHNCGNLQIIVKSFMSAVNCFHLKSVFVIPSTFFFLHAFVGTPRKRGQRAISTLS